MSVLLPSRFGIGPWRCIDVENEDPSFYTAMFARQVHTGLPFRYPSSSIAPADKNS
jgi:hypothetical protein